MNPTPVINDLFSFVLSTLTGGIVTDIKTAMFGLLAIFLIYIGVDLLVARTFGMTIREHLEYRDYSYQRRKKENFERWYESEENKHFPVGPEKPRKNYLD